MNMNARFLEEAKQLEAKWATLKSDKKFSRVATAQMLECERLHNETGNWDCCEDCKKIEKEKQKSDEERRNEV